ncbi:RNA polymerase sigma factor [Dictyobacter arantiisoli]|nr:RNA polymerase sigma factor [Dictyobacter arantiisoli]
MPAAQAVEVLIHEYYKLVFHTIYGLTNNWEESQDLTQDTFHQALKGIDAARASSKGHFQAKAWLLRIALNTVRMQRRRRALFSFIPFSMMHTQRSMEGKEQIRVGEDAIHEQATPVQPGGYGSTETTDPAELIAEQDAVQRTMAQLPEGLRECLLLSIVGGLSSLEIARLLEVKEDAVRQRLARARKQFQQLYTRESGEEIVDNTAPVPTGSSVSYGGQERKQGQQRQDKRQHLSLATPPPSLWSSYV